MGRKVKGPFTYLGNFMVNLSAYLPFFGISLTFQRYSMTGEEADLSFRIPAINSPIIKLLLLTINLQTKYNDL